jgi:hypothetical protein
MSNRKFMNSRPTSYIPKLSRGNSIPVVAVSPRGNTHIYPSITQFVRDVEGLDLSQRRTASRRVATGGGYIENWYVAELRGYSA